MNTHRTVHVHFHVYVHVHSTILLPTRTPSSSIRSNVLLLNTSSTTSRSLTPLTLACTILYPLLPFFLNHVEAFRGMTERKEGIHEWRDSSLWSDPWY